MRPLPHAFLTLPRAPGAELSPIIRKVRLLALRALLTRCDVITREELAEQSRRAPDATLAAVGRADVICVLLSVESGAAPVSLLPSAVAALRGPAPGGVPLHPRVPGLHLSLTDTNPLAMDEAHPEKSGNAVDLSGRPVEEWRAALAAALELVEAGLPEWFAELPLALQRIVPVGFHAERHLSASYREAPGLAYLSLHPDPLTLAEAIVHETQHGKLNALSWLDPVLENGHTEWSPSPVRPDLRPLMGVLLAAHAFVPVAALHARLADLGHPAMLGKEARRAEVLRSNAAALEAVRAKGKTTALGQRLVTELEALHAALAGQ